MKQQSFESLYSDSWQQLETVLAECETRRWPFWKQHNDARLPPLYRRVCHHLSLAQERHYSSSLIAKLNDLVLRSHQQFYRRETHFWFTLVQLILVTFPTQVRENRRYFYLASVLFYGPALLLFVLIKLQPELIYSMFDHSVVNNFEAMYDPTADHVGEDRAAQSDVQMFGHYIQNNISVGFQTFATGIFFGLGSLFYVIYNGLILGGVAAHMINIGYVDTFFPFIIAHGSFELTAIVIAGMGGLMLGHALIAPGQFSRLEALRNMGQRTLPLLYGMVVFLVIAAFLEAFWSSNSALPLTLKYTVGAILWLLVIAYLSLSGRKRSNQAQQQQKPIIHAA